ncbi:SDR family NAD(P)-dependent oxidoreductase [Demetria terragena]|uniref:SDR family NAD(P)-dependent oxidoreductase n=1 Tax=Demetria terragena TaxID=63959 RepID=UPI0003668CEC|nr:SDR family NAD(P)-dependent oxidoreductase [Demetria terragena]
MDLQHQVVWVVGASTGIGAAIAREMQARGARVAITARRRETLDEVSGGAMLAAPADVTDPESLDAAARTVHHELGPVDILVFTAAETRQIDIADWDRQAFADVVNVSLVGASNAIGAVLPSMIERRSGTIVGFIAPAAFRGYPSEEAFGAAKAGLRNLLESLAIDARRYNIKVATATPAGVRSSAGQSLPGLPAAIDPDTAARAVCDGLERERHHIAFPGRLARPMRLVRLAPRAVWPAVAERLSRRR